MGAATLDTIAAVPHHPGPDARVVASDFALAGGGPAATAAVALARLDVRVYFVGSVADDEAGSAIREGLARERVDVSELAVCAGGRSAQSSILVDRSTATRTIATFPGELPPLRASTGARELCASAAWVHVDHAGYSAARDLDPLPRLSIDAGNPIAGLSLDSVSLFSPTESALARLYPGLDARAAASRSLAAGAEVVVVTRGARGSFAALGDSSFVEAEPFEVDVVSTLGAGDVFHGALLAGLVEGRPLPDVLARANAAAALSCRALDGRSAVPYAAELEHAL
jgi:sugar/nucleoside kinase (ribokinase family)